MGSTRPANFPEEAQLASARQRPTAAAQRAARAAESARRIPIRPNYHCTGGLPYPGMQPAFATIRPTSASTCEDIATGTRRKWGEVSRGEPMVTRSSRGFAGKAALLLAPFETPVAEKPRSSRFVRTRPEIFLTVQARHRLVHVRGAQRTDCNVRDNDCDDGTGRRRNISCPCFRGYPLAGLTAGGCV